MKPPLLLIGLATLVTGCGEQVDELINGGYDETFQAECLSSFGEAGLSKTQIKQVCTCTLDEINKQFSEIEKLTMSEDDVTPIMLACLNKAVK
mgnify:CR=1 FL=1